jgi:hypothetical protein
VRTGFDRRRRKCKLTFDQIRKRLKRGDTLASIALAAGVARSRMRIIYELWFRELLHLPRGRDRREKQLKEKRKITQEKLKKLPPRDVFRVIARQEGHQFVKPVPQDQRTRPGQIRARELYVHSRLCGVHHLRNVHRQKGRHATYATTTVSLVNVERQDFKTFYIETGYGRKLIDMKREDLLALFKHPGQQRAKVYFPLQ